MPDELANELAAVLETIQTAKEQLNKLLDKSLYLAMLLDRAMANRFSTRQLGPIMQEWHDSKERGSTVYGLLLLWATTIEDFLEENKE